MTQIGDIVTVTLPAQGRYESNGLLNPHAGEDATQVRVEIVARETINGTTYLRGYDRYTGRRVAFAEWILDGGNDGNRAH
jgi:hypothetical protein